MVNGAVNSVVNGVVTGGGRSGRGDVAVAEQPLRDQRSRTLVVWCPDWPAVAAARQAGKPASDPVAVFHANRVQACTGAARAEGIHVGMRRRDAQSRCPELLIAQVDHDRDARLFEPVAAAVEAIAPGVEILRSGVVACPARGPRRYFGSDNAAAEKIVDAVESLDIECSVGVADVLAVAVLAAHRGVIVAPGRSAEFCSPLPITELARDPAISPPERAALADLLIRLGITTAGAFAALPEGKVATRFGADGIQAHRLARGLAERGVSRRQIPQELAVRAGLRSAAGSSGHGGLRGAGAGRAFPLPARRCRSGLYPAGHHRHHRTGCQALPGLALRAAADRRRHRRPIALATRRLAHRRPYCWSKRPSTSTEVEGPGAISLLILEPIEAIGAGHIQYGLWGSDGQDDQRAGWAFARVQGLLGPESVLAPVLAGGRSAVDRITLVPWGDERVSPQAQADPWPGSLPAPSPTRVTAGSREIRASVAGGLRGPRRGGSAGPAHRSRTVDRIACLARPVGRTRKQTPARRRLGRAMAAGRTVVVGEPAASRRPGADRHRGRGRHVAATGHRRLAGRGGVRLMGWNNPNVPWSELERALSGRPPRPGTGPIGPLRPAGGDRPGHDRPDPAGEAPAGIPQFATPGTSPDGQCCARGHGNPGALRGTALPFRLQLPRRSFHPRAPGGGGAAARAGRAGDHRPRRSLRHRPVRRGRSGHPTTDPLRCRAVPRPARTADGYRGPGR